MGLFFAGYVPPENGALLDAMRQIGYIEGQSVVYLRQTATASTVQDAAQLVAAQPDVIVTSAPLNVRALKKATTTVPIVMAVTGDAVEAGLVASLARPGENVTGLSFQGRDLVLKRLQLLRFPIADGSGCSSIQ